MRFSGRIIAIIVLLCNFPPGFCADNSVLGIHPFVEGSAFNYAATGEVYLVKLDCQFVRQTWESSP